MKPLSSVSLLLVVFLGVFQVQLAIDSRANSSHSSQERLYFPSGPVLKKLALGHSGLLADIYWMRAVQYYGGKRLEGSRDFPLLSQLIEIATTLDPHLLPAYRFGAIFLSEPQAGANQPQAAVPLLVKAIEHNPGQWQLYRDLGFVYYWYLNDYRKAADAFLEGSKHAGSPKWMKTFAADLLARGGSRKAARFLWEDVYATSENKQMKQNAQENLMSLTADDELEVLQDLVEKVQRRTGKRVESLQELVGLGILKTYPLDPKGFRYELDLSSGKVRLASESTIRRHLGSER